MGFSWGDLAKTIPGVNTIYRLGSAAGDAVTGDESGALDNLKKTGYDLGTGGLYDTGLQAGYAGNAIENGVKNIGNSIKNAYDAPFEQKKAGYQAVQDQAAAYEQQRRNQQQVTLAQTLAQYDPAKKAMAAVYGDPSTWRIK
jgi:hypothetical protein